MILLFMLIGLFGLVVGLMVGNLMQDYLEHRMLNEIREEIGLPVKSFDLTKSMVV